MDITHFVQVTNSHIDMYILIPPIPGGLAGLPLVQSVTLATFFGYTTETLSIRVSSMIPHGTGDRDRSGVSGVLHRPALFIAVSTTADPTGSFFMYNLIVTFFTGDFYDFPQLGMDQDAILFTEYLQWN